MAAGSALAQAPLSSIDWLSQAASEPAPSGANIATSAAPPDITVAPLDRLSKDPVGLLPSHVTGLGRNIWSASREHDLVTLIRAERRDQLPAMRELTKILMLAEADPPLDAGVEDTLFLARVDRLIELGALEQAKALIELAGPDTDTLFQRWFDVSLLLGTENIACRAMGANMALAPSTGARIFCQARNGDWRLAELSLNTHRVLGDISAAEFDALARFLDPELFEGAPPLPPPLVVTPLLFRLHEAFGEPLVTTNLPLAFAHADLRGNNAWKSQIEAAERLARMDAVPENVLQKFYTGRRPAASGGIWDRAAAVIRLDQALIEADTDAVAAALPAAWEAMKQARTEVPFAKLYSTALQNHPLQGDAGAILQRIGLLSPDYRQIADALAQNGTAFDPFAVALARGAVQDASPSTPRALAVQAAFAGAPAPADLQNLVANGKTGEAILRAQILFSDGFAGDARAITDALALLRLVGLDDLARRAALQMLLLDRAT